MSEIDEDRSIGSTPPRRLTALSRTLQPDGEAQVVLGRQQHHNDNRTADESDARVPGPDRRHDRRYVTVFRVAKLDAGGVEGLGIVRNLSEGGMMVASPASLTTGQQVAVSLIDGLPIQGRVVWANGEAVGISFEQRVGVADILSRSPVGAGQRPARLPRLHLGCDGRLETALNSVAAYVLDVSQRGAKVSVLGHRLTKEDIVSLRLPAREPVKATVRWVRDDLLGLEFHAVLPVSELIAWLPAQAGGC